MIVEMLHLPNIPCKFLNKVQMKKLKLHEIDQIEEHDKMMIKL